MSNRKNTRPAINHTYQIYKWLHPNDKTYLYEPPEQRYDAKKALQYYHDMILNRLQTVLIGDFSWERNLEKKNKMMSAKIQYIIEKLPKEHPIRKKFWSGDPTWLQDIDEHLRMHPRFLLKKLMAFFKTK